MFNSYISRIFRDWIYLDILERSLSVQAGAHHRYKLFLYGKYQFLPGWVSASVHIMLQYARYG